MPQLLLKLSIGGLELENPFLLASAPPTARVESILKAFSFGWAGAVLKTISHDPAGIRDASPRFGVLRDRQKQVIGFENFEILSRKDLAYWKEGIVTLKREYPKKVVIASIMAPCARQEWQTLVAELQTTPLDAFELNFSCPHGMPEQGMGMAIGTSTEISAQITSWVKEVAKVPVFVKLSPNVTDIAAIALAVQKAGADGLSAINTVQSLIGVDLDSLEPQPGVRGYSTFGGYSGRAVKPIGLRCVAQAKAATGLPMFAMGGIASWREAVEYMAVGGDAVQVCTEVMLSGYAIIKDMLSGLTGYLESKGLDSIRGVHGAALPKLITHGQLSKARHTAVIDAAQCRSCGKCLTLCDESGYSAIARAETGYIIDGESCDGCGLCLAACPYQAIAMRF